MPSPTSTYRFQVRDSFGFRDVGERAAYLARLGVTHAYLSPVLRATPGSAHGYDVVSHSDLSEDAGGRPGFDAMVTSLRDSGVAAVADVVPNHMATPTPARLNAPYWSLLKEGPESPYASWFDVNWAPGRIIVPVLGDRLPEVLASEEISVDGSVVRYFDHEFPVRAGTEHLPLDELLAKQWYRLAFWRTSDEELNYRRFFDVTSLIAVRVEDPTVFSATHALIKELVRDGSLDGLRIDHPDGLADPRGYLRDLAAATGDTWVVVEKILEGDETLPSDWKCAGTTGYDALNRVGGLFVDPDGAAPLSGLLTRFTGDERSLEAIVEASKRQIIDTSLHTEVRRLDDLLAEIRDFEPAFADFTRRGLHTAVVELLVAMDRYRAYVVPGEAAPPEAVATLDRAHAMATTRVAPEFRPALDLVKDILLDGVRAGSDAARAELITRFQQTCGPVMAKGIEDTTFYRYHRLISLNEVGGEPGHFGVAADEFHAFCARIARDWPLTMTTLSTHDTKRSEDARARLAPLSEVPGEWATAVTHWRELAAKYHSPDPSTEYLFWQTLLAVPDIDAERMTAYLSKATREAKQLTSWTTPNTTFDEAVASFARAVLADDEIMGAVNAFGERIAPAVRAVTLGQKLVQLTMPGVPDVYQGTEVVDLSLVDPDNRRPVDYAYRDKLLTLVEQNSLAVLELDPEELLDGEKLLTTYSALHLRRAHPDWFAEGTYTAVPTSSTHAVAFGRGPAEQVQAITVATRLALTLERHGGWGDSVVVLPEGRWLESLSGRFFDGGPLRLADLLDQFPVALLVHR